MKFSKFIRPLEYIGNTLMKNMPHICYRSIPEYPPLAVAGQDGHTLSSEVTP
jgi:hypothetical protein